MNDKDILDSGKIIHFVIGFIMFLISFLPTMLVLLFEGFIVAFKISLMYFNYWTKSDIKNLKFYQSIRVKKIVKKAYGIK